MKKTYIVNGITYHSLKELAEQAGVSYDAAYARKRRGWSDDEIFYGRIKKTFSKPKSLLTSKRSGQILSIQGKNYNGIKHAYDIIKPDVKFNTVRKRFEGYGWSPEEALGLVEKVDGRKNPNRTKRPNKQDITSSIVAFGDRYNSIRSLANEYDMPYELVYNRIHMYGWSPERAVTERATSKVTVYGEKYRSALDAFDKIGKVSYSNYQERKRKGLPLEICLGLAPLPEIIRYEVEGKWYSTLAEVAAAYDLNLGQLTGRLNQMTLEEAVHYRPSNGRYSETIFRRDRTLANSKGIFYFIKILIHNKWFYKVGITQRSITNRFPANRIEVVFSCDGKMENLHKLEQSVVSRYSSFCVRADDSFEGRTETFKFSTGMVEEVLSYIKRNVV